MTLLIKINVMENFNFISEQQIKVVNIDQLKEVESFRNFYEESSQEDQDQLKQSLKVKGQLVPVIVFKDYSINDGYRRVGLLKDLGIKVVKVIVLDEEPSLDQRISYNLYRVKTHQDVTNEVLSVFKSTPKKQGTKNDGVPYDRYQIIMEKLDFRWKSGKSIRKVDSIIKDDLENNLLLNGVVNKGWTLDDCELYVKKLKKKDLDKKHGFTKQLIEGKLSINQVNKFIQEKDDLEKGYNDTFVIPKKSKSFNINCRNLKDTTEFLGKVNTIMTSIPYWKLRFYENDEDYNQLGHEKTPEEYATNVANIFKQLETLLNKESNVFINIGDTYVDGCAIGVPGIVKDAILKHTNLKFKDQLVWSKPNPRPQNETIERPINNLEYVLWFVVDPKESKYNLIKYTDKVKEIKVTDGAKDVSEHGKVWDRVKSLTKPYQKIYSHMAAQDVLHMIKCSAGMNSPVYKAYSKGGPAVMAELLPVLPIMMTTDEGDIVYDPMAGTNVVGRMSMLLNRVALSTELSSHYHKIGCRVIDNTQDEINTEDLKVITNEFMIESPLRRVA